MSRSDNAFITMKANLDNKVAEGMLYGAPIGQLLDEDPRTVAMWALSMWKRSTGLGWSIPDRRVK